MNSSSNASSPCIITLTVRILELQVTSELSYITTIIIQPWTPSETWECEEVHSNGHSAVHDEKYEKFLAPFPKKAKIVNLSLRT